MRAPGEALLLFTCMPCHCWCGSRLPTQRDDEDERNCTIKLPHPLRELLLVCCPPSRPIVVGEVKLRKLKCTLSPITGQAARPRQTAVRRTEATLGQPHGNGRQTAYSKAAQHQL